jgi:hypothetical protein
LLPILECYGIAFTDFSNADLDFIVQLEIKSMGLCADIPMDNLTIGLLLMKVGAWVNDQMEKVGFTFDEVFSYDNLIAVVNDAFAKSYLIMIKKNFFDNPELLEAHRETLTRFWEDVMSLVKTVAMYGELDPNQYFVSVLDLDITYKIFERC